MLHTHHASTRDLARSLSEFLTPHGHTLHPLLYNRFDAEHSAWWLSPERIRPAYRLAKIHVDCFRKGSPDFLVGMVIERGLPHSLLGKSHQMTSSWDWHQVLPRLESKGEALHSRLWDCGAPAEVYVSMGWSNQSRDVVHIPILENGLGEPERECTGAPQLDTLIGVTSIQDLATAVAALPAGLWIDVVIGARVTRTDLSPSQRVPALTAITDRLVAPLADWLWGTP